MSNKVFVSPGVYTSEQDLTFITSQVGVTSLGLVGETTIGPAFQPIFVENYDQFKSFFGGLNNSLVKETGAPLYELPYIAKSYLTQTNQLYVTRVLGLSGFDAGKAWAITLDSAADPSSIVITQGPTNVSSLINFTATTAGTIVALSSSEPLIQTLIAKGAFSSTLSFLGSSAINSTAEISRVDDKVGSNFEGVSFSLQITAKAASGGVLTGSTSGVTTYYSGTSYSEVDNKVVALIRSRGKVDITTQAPIFEVNNTNGIGFTTESSGVTVNPLAVFTITGTSATNGAFSYEVSMDKTQKNYLPKVLGRTAQDGKSSIFVEELYGNMFNTLLTENKIRGLKTTMVNYGTSFDDYKTEYTPAVTPYVVSELRGNKVLRLFRLWTISDGNAANEQFKISIVNIKPDAREFDVYVRGFYDSDDRPVVLESYTRCTMDPTSANFIGRKIGTIDGTYGSTSKYILVELETETDTADAFPAGFVGYPVRDYSENGNTSVVAPHMQYKSKYSSFENKRRSYLGLSNTVGIDADFFDFKGIPNSAEFDQWTGLTAGYHMDVDASGVTIENVTIPIDSVGGTYSPVYSFETGDWQFRTDDGLLNGPYEKIFARKFTFAPYGGFDGWDVYRSRRSNLDNFTINGSRGAAGLVSGTFANRTVSNGDAGINSDYYAYLEAIYTFKNPSEVNINVFATPGIDTFDHTNLVEAAIDVMERERADSLYVVTTPDTDGSGNVLSIDEVSESLDGNFDSNYTTTFWPWVQVNDAENNAFIYLPPTRDALRNIALTDNIAFPWFASAGLQRGKVDAIKARIKLTESQRDALYEHRINPLLSTTTDGINIWGNKTLQVAETALNRINVRRLLLQTRKLISAVCLQLVFEPNDVTVRNQFLGIVNPILSNIRTERGLTDFRVEVSASPEDMDRNTLVGKIFIKPTRALEFIDLNFILTPTGASFDNI